jgi:hypothetical protein
LQCSDPRDAVYAFLGHPSAFKRPLFDSEPYNDYSKNFDGRKETFISPDYHEKFSLNKLYFVLASSLIHRGEGLGLLDYIGHDEETIGERYMWAPRWNSDEQLKSPPQVTDLYGASSGLQRLTFELSVVFKDDSQTLERQAVVITSVHCATQVPAAPILGSDGRICSGSSFNALEHVYQCAELMGNDPLYPRENMESYIISTMTAGLYERLRISEGGVPFRKCMPSLEYQPSDLVKYLDLPISISIIRHRPVSPSQVFTEFLKVPISIQIVRPAMLAQCFIHNLNCRCK